MVSQHQKCWSLFATAIAMCTITTCVAAIIIHLNLAPKLSGLWTILQHGVVLQYSIGDQISALERNYQIYERYANFEKTAFFQFSKYTPDELFYFSERSIIVAGMGRNIESTIIPLLNQIEIEFGCVFKQTVIIIFESNSVDKSAQRLHEWSNREPLTTVHPECDQNVKKIVLNDTHFQLFHNKSTQHSNENQFLDIREIQKTQSMYDIDNVSEIPQNHRIFMYANFRNFLLSHALQVC